MPWRHKIIQRGIKILRQIKKIRKRMCIGGIIMWLGKVVGTVVAPTKNESLVGNKLLVVQPLNLDGMNTISLQVAIDTVGAGNGETVLVTTGSSARQVTHNSNSAVDAAIVGIVENIDLEGISKAQYWVQKG
jgi:microcompartment protein CcmK/EutM